MSGPNPFPMDYDTWLTTEPECEEPPDLEAEPDDFDLQRWLEGER